MCAEIKQQTGCETTHHICDRIYDCLLQIYGALYLIRQGWNVRFLPMQPGGPDIEASRGTVTCFMECTFKHTSKKLESLFWRFDSACRRILAKKPILFSAQFRFPNAENFKVIPSDLCKATREFIAKVYAKPNEVHYGIFEDLKFEFEPALPPTTIIDKQCDAASALAAEFYRGNLSQLLESKAKQLNVPGKSDYQKILFIGLQSDPIYCTPWTDPAMPEVKLLLALKAHYKHGIKLIFSDDVGFSVEGYL